MLKLDIKSLIIGALATVSFFALISSKPLEGDKMEVAIMANGGISTFNKETKTLGYFDRPGVGKTVTAPQIFTISDDGSSVTRIK